MKVGGVVLHGTRPRALGRGDEVEERQFSQRCLFHNNTVSPTAVNLLRCARGGEPIVLLR